MNWDVICSMLPEEDEIGSYIDERTLCEKIDQLNEDFDADGMFAHVVFGDYNLVLAHDDYTHWMRQWVIGEVNEARSEYDIVVICLRAAYVWNFLLQMRNIPRDVLREMDCDAPHGEDEVEVPF